MDLYWTAEMAAEQGPREEALRCFDQWRDTLRRYLMCAGARPEDADDAVQETFLRLYQHLARGGDRSNLGGWIFRVARNYVRDEKKSARNHRTVAWDDVLKIESGPADPDRTPECRALDAERSRRLRDAIARLPEHQRECMLLRASGLRYREIAAVLGINTSSVGAAVSRATARLTEELL